MSELLIGTGGWAYFQVPGSDSLGAYAQAFNFVELNSSYYELPTLTAATAWRKKVPSNFSFAVRSPRILVDHYGLRLLPGSKILMDRLAEVCQTLEAKVMTVLIRNDSPVKQEALASRLEHFLESWKAEDAKLAIELRNIECSGDVVDVMKEGGAIHAVDISREESP